MQYFEELEQKFAEWVGGDWHMVAVSSGTAALHIGLETLELEQGTSVIVPDYTMVACPRAIVMAGLKPMFADCGADLLIDGDSTIDLLMTHYDGEGNSNWHPGKKITAAMPVNIYGRQYDVFRIRKQTESLSIAIIEDMSEIHGVAPSYNADVACWSFYKNKIIAGEEGGMVGFKEEAHATRARQLRSLGFTNAHNFNHIPRGVNARMSNSHAYLILRSLAHVSENLEDRRMIESWYDSFTPKEWQMPKRDSVWVYDVRIPGMRKQKQIEVITALNNQGIEARFGFQPMSAQVEFLDPTAATRNVNAYRAANEILYLPVTTSMTVEQVRANCEALERAIGSAAVG